MSDLNNLSERGKKEILIRVPDKDFRRLCSTNKEFNEYCNQYPHSEELFKERSLYWFDDDIVRRKKADTTWKDFYTYVVHFIDDIPNNLYLEAYAQDLASSNKLLELIILFKVTGVLPGTIILNTLAEKNNIDIFAWLVDKELYPIDIMPSVYAAGKNHLDIIKFLYDLDDPNERKLVTAQTASSAMWNDKIDILNWLETKGIYPREDRRYITYEHHPLAFKWLRDRNLI